MVASLERLEPRIALGDVAFAALGLYGLPDLLAPPVAETGEPLPKAPSAASNDRPAEIAPDRGGDEPPVPAVAETPPIQTSRAAALEAPARDSSVESDFDAVLTTDLADEVLAPPAALSSSSTTAPPARDPLIDSAPKGGGGGAGGQDAARGGGGGSNVGRGNAGADATKVDFSASSAGLTTESGNSRGTAGHSELRSAELMTEQSCLDFTGTHSGNGTFTTSGQFSASGTGTVTGDIQGQYTIQFSGTGSLTSGTFSGTISGALNGTFSGTYTGDGSGGIVTDTSYSLQEGPATGDGAFSINLSDLSFTFSGTIERVNAPPIAYDDAALVSIPESPNAIPIYVLVNDGDPDGDNLSIQSVSSSQAGATIWVDPSGTFIWYLPPTILGDGASIGAHYNLGMAEDTGTVDDILDGGDFLPFEDSFEYVIADCHGATDIGFVAVQDAGTPSWSYKLLSQFDEAAEIGIDGVPGYDLNILQTYGKDARGKRAPARTQVWQANTYTAKTAYFDAMGRFRLESNENDPWVIADVNDVSGKQTPINITDNLGEDPSPNADETIMMVSVIDKNLGFNQQGKRLPNGNGDRANAEMKAALNNLRGPTLSVTTNYVFIDKKLAEDKLAAGDITQVQFNAIKAAVEGMELAWGTLPNKYEQYQISDHAWQFPEP